MSKKTPFYIHCDSEDESVTVVTKKRKSVKNLSTRNGKYVIVHSISNDEIDSVNEIRVTLEPVTQTKRRHETIKTFLRLIFNSKKDKEI